MNPWLWFGGVLLAGVFIHRRTTLAARRASQIARLVETSPPLRGNQTLRRHGRFGTLVLRCVSQLGRAVIRTLPWSTSASPAAIGTTTLLGVMASLVSPLLGVIVVVTSAARTRRIRRLHEQHRVAAIRSELSLLLDLLRVAVSAGLTMRQSILITCGAADRPLTAERYAVDGSGELSALLLNSVTGVGRGERYVDALAAMVDTPIIGPELGLLASTLIGTERFGTPPGPALASLATDVRDLRRRLAEAEARRVPIRMLAPLVLLLLPSFALLTLAPLLAGGLSSLRLTP